MMFERPEIFSRQNVIRAGVGNITLLKLIAKSFVTVLVILIGGCQPVIPEEIELAYASLPEQVDFNFHIRPILSDRCYKCHGPDDETREAGLRLDVEKNAFARLRESRGHAFVKNKARKSIAWQRMLADDPDYQMPPPESNLSLSDREKALITKWIEQGAEWKRHWSYITPEKPEVPPELPASWNRFNVLDHFIQDELLQQGLQPSPLAGKERLIRRLSFDLRGLPPSHTEIDDFLADPSPDAYEKLVDHFLRSESHAERLAIEWMDVSRYADSHGLHADGLRTMWPWRDWVIKAFHENLPYNDFIIWQIAGDLLQDATPEQKLATGFYRNQPLNSELGIINEEFRLKYAADRTNTTGTAFLGMTLECASCHDHKFDPISQKEYYQLTSFFNNVHELGMIGNDKNFGPLMLLPEKSVEDSIIALTTLIRKLEEKRETHEEEIIKIKEYLELDTDNIQSPSPIGFYPLESVQSVKSNDGSIYFTTDHDNDVMITGKPESVKGRSGNAIRIDDDYENILISGLRNFDLHDSFSASAWIKTEKSGTFQSIIGNIGDKNTGWRGWIFYLDSLRRPGFKMVHSLSHNYIHIRARNSIKQAEWCQLFFTYDGSALAKGVKIYANGISLDCEILFDNLYKSISPVKHRNYTPDPERKLRMGIGTKYLFSETDDGAFVGTIDEVRVYEMELSSLEIMKIFKQDSGIHHLSNGSEKDLARHYLLRIDTVYQDLSRQVIDLRKQKQQLLDPVQEVMVMEEKPEPRRTFVLDRGQYDQPTELVSAKTPSAIMPMPSHFP
ncbi:MAG: DUF1549 domain-containing protein, partial [Saprospiraceae bacterium]|nr:DUF1549 domain-containing protein [Saprospiraceae bacterium]